MAAATPTLRGVDHLKNKVTLTFRVDTKGMVRGEQRHMHQGVASIVSAAKIKHIDILNPTSAKITASSNAGAVGITLFHDLNGADGTPHILDTDDHVTHADSGSYGIEAAAKPTIQAKEVPSLFGTASGFGVGEDAVVNDYVAPTSTAFDDDEDYDTVSDPLRFHSVAHSGVVTTSQDLMLNPTADQHKDRRLSLQRKIGPNWDGYTVENVKAGAYHAGMKDHPDEHWLIAEKDHRTGTKSAIWNLIDINDGTTELWGGAYNHAKTKKAGLTVHGMPAKKVSTAHYNEAVKTLQTSLQTYSPFGQGLGVAVQKLDDSPATGDTMVTVELTRTPMHVKNGYVPPERKEILTEDHIVKINGGGRRAGARGAVGSTTTAAGFEKYIKGDFTAADVLERVVITPADEYDAE